MFALEEKGLQVLCHNPLLLEPVTEHGRLWPVSVPEPLCVYPVAPLDAHADLLQVTVWV